MKNEPSTHTNGETDKRTLNDPRKNIDHEALAFDLSRRNQERRRAGILKPRQEKFCQLMAACDKSDAQCAREAGYSNKHASTAATRLKNDPLIIARIDQLMREAGHRNKVNLDEVIANLRRARDKAMEVGQYSAAVRAIELLGKYLGMFSDKVNVNQTLSYGRAADLKRLKTISGLGSKANDAE